MYLVGSDWFIGCPTKLTKIAIVTFAIFNFILLVICYLFIKITLKLTYKTQI